MYHTKENIENIFLTVSMDLTNSTTFPQLTVTPSSMYSMISTIDYLNISNSSGSSTNNCAISLTEFLIYFYIQPVICFCGFILNLLNVAIFRKSQFMGAAYAYMIAMSMADAITLISYMPSGLVRCAGYFPYCHDPTFKKVRTGLLYYNTYVLFPLGNMSETASVWFTLVLSLERYLTMSHLGAVYQTRINYTKQQKQQQPIEEIDLQNNSNSFINSLENCDNDDYYKTKNNSHKNKIKTRLNNRFLNFFLNLCTMKNMNLRNQIKSIICWSNKIFKSRLCANFNYKHSILLVTLLSILLNLPLCFVQKVVHKPRIITIKSTFIPRDSTDETEGTILPSLNSTQQTQVYSGLTDFGNSEFYKLFSWVRFVLVQGLPLLFLCIANFCLFRLIRIASTRRQQVLRPQIQQAKTKKRLNLELHKQNLRCPKTNGGSSSRWQTAQRKLTVLLIVIVALFLAGQIPQAFAYIAIFEAFINYFGTECITWRCCPPYLIYRAIAHLLCLFTYAINFFVYLTLNKHFKHQIERWCSLCCPHTKYYHTQKSTYYQTKSESSVLRKPGILIDKLNMLKHKINSPVMSQYESVYYRSKNNDMFSKISDWQSEAVSAPADFYNSPKLCKRNAMRRHRESAPERIRNRIFIKNNKFHPKCFINYNPKTCSNQQLNTPISINSIQMNSNPISSSLQLSECHTEIRFDPQSPPYVTQCFHAYFSHDSIMKHWTFHNPYNKSISGQISINPTDTIQWRKQILQSENQTTKLYQQGNQTSQSDKSNIFSGQTLPSYNHCRTCSAISSNSDDLGFSSSHLFCPLVFRESDFDIISVDTNLADEDDDNTNTTTNNNNDFNNPYTSLINNTAM